MTDIEPFEVEQMKWLASLGYRLREIAAFYEVSKSTAQSYVSGRRAPGKLRPYERVPVLDRLLAKVKYEAGCWIFTGGLNRYGYGAISLYAETGEHKRKLTHRVTYEEMVGPVPDGVDLDHLCRNPACCNPIHLEPVSHAENIRRGTAPAAIARWHASRTHCKHGHEFTPENTSTAPGYRVCKTCRDRTQAATRAKRKAAA